jgi:hypothetical protein
MYIDSPPQVPSDSSPGMDENALRTNYRNLLQRGTQQVTAAVSESSSIYEKVSSRTSPAKPLTNRNQMTPWETPVVPIIPESPHRIEETIVIEDKLCLNLAVPLVGEPDHDSMFISLIAELVKPIQEHAAPPHPPRRSPSPSISLDESRISRTSSAVQRSPSVRSVRSRSGVSVGFGSSLARFDISTPKSRTPTESRPTGTVPVARPTIRTLNRHFSSFRNSSGIFPKRSI